MWDYSDKVMDHFLHPRNIGEIEDPDGVGEVGSISCGDALRLTFKLDSQGRIVDAKFKTFGCGSAIASSSILTEMIKGLTLEEASKITNQQIAEALGGLPPEKMHCSVMGREALQAAIDNYRGISPKQKEEMEGRLICQCFGVHENLIRKVIRENNLTTLEQITNYCKAGGGCTSCHPALEEILVDEMKARVAPRPDESGKADKKKPLTNIQKINMIQEIIDKEIRPLLQNDGGDIELIDVVGDRVLVRLKGSCVGCVASNLTIKSLVEDKLREFVSDNIIVEEVNE
jgi:NifU-like protein